MGVNPQLARAVACFGEAGEALKTLAGDNRTVYLHEVRKLCLAIQSADEVRRALARAGAKPQQGLVAREISHQIMAFSYLREIPEEAALEAHRQTEQSYPESQQADPALSRAGLLVKELQNRAPAVTDDQVHRGLALQPLTALLVEQGPLVEQLEGLYPFCIDYTYQVLYQTSRELEGLV